MRVTVTGATGKVGNAVTRMLLERGDEVVAVVRDPARASKLLPAGATPVAGDVTDIARCRVACEGAEAVFNCMGIYEQWVRDPKIFDRVNAQGARNVARAAREAGARRMVHTSTFDVFEAPEGGMVSEDRLAAEPKGTAYERSKQRAEALVLAEAGDSLDVVITNPAGVIGPGPWAAAGLDRSIADAIRGRLPAVPPGGLTLCFVNDVAAGHLAALDRGRPGERYILADGYAEIGELIAHAVECAGRGRAPRTLPLGLAKALARGGEALSRLIRRPPLLATGQLHFLQWQVRADSSKAGRELGFEPTPWRQAVESTVRWMVDGGRV